jgi:hypothetical protein
MSRGVAGRHDDLLAVAAALERLALNIREEVDRAMDDDEDVQEPEEVPVPVAEAVPVVPAAGLRRGQRVRITIEDRYVNQIGTLVDRRGIHFWNILMDAADGGVSCLIYKKESSFALIIDN